jgi:hypothetical protein
MEIGGREREIKKESKRQTQMKEYKIKERPAVSKKETKTKNKE